MDETFCKELAILSDTNAPYYSLHSYVVDFSGIVLYSNSQQMICKIPPKYGHIRLITCAGQSGIPRSAGGELIGISGLGGAIPNSAKLPPPRLPGQTSDILTVDRG